jgi:hypothetical protein
MNKKENNRHWFAIENANEVLSPGLVIYEERVVENIR